MKKYRHLQIKEIKNVYIKKDLNIEEKEFHLKDLKKMYLNQILDYYNNDIDTPHHKMSDIYYYIYCYNLSDKKCGKYTENLIERYKSSNIKQAKNNFRKITRNYIIDNDKKLVKIVPIKNYLTEKTILKSLLTL